MNNLKMCALINRFDERHEEPLRQDISFCLGMLHGGVLTPDANTLVIVHTKDFREGYERGRRDYFTQYEEIAHTEVDLLKAHAQDNLYLGREQSTLRWAIGCTVELSGRLFPLTKQEQPHKHSASQVKRVTVLHEA